MSDHGLPCWYELASRTPAKATAFYGPLLGWTWSSVDMGTMIYHMAATSGGQVAGMMAADDGQPTAWSIYFAVDDCDKTAALAVSLGSAQIVPPSDIPGTGRFAVLIDPQGAAFALLQPLPGGQGGAYDQQKPGHGNWNELVTADAEAGLAFYGKLFGWTISRSVPMGPDMTYHIIARGGADIGGAFNASTPPFWKPYFGVASTSAAAAEVKRLGGRVLHGPDQVPGGGYTLQITDAEGIFLALTGPA
jgi:predicted enzyme related to lactoylglutathione lyase